MGFDPLVFLVGRARHPGPTSLPSHFGVEFLNVGGWLTHGDFAPKVGVDFLAVAEHRLIPAPGLRGKGSLLFGLLPLRIPSHVGDAIRMRGAPLALLAFAAAQFQRFFDCGRVVRCMVPLGFGRFMHLVVFFVFKVLILMLSSFR